jgi:hypothetical protein
LKRTIAIVVVRTVGTFAVLCGAMSLYNAASVALASDDQISLAARLIFSALILILSTIFIWIGYLSWFRLSPRAVQQICGLLGFVVIGTFNTLSQPIDPQKGLWWAASFFAVLVFVLFGYRILSRYLSNVIFSPNQPIAVESAK